LQVELARLRQFKVLMAGLVLVVVVVAVVALELLVGAVVHQFAVLVVQVHLQVLLVLLSKEAVAVVEDLDLVTRKTPQALVVLVVVVQAVLEFLHRVRQAQ
jgi:hypothetical protein